MPSFPPPGAVTICEINRDLVAADALSDDRAKDAYGNVLGMVFSPIPFQPDALLPNRQPPAADQAEPAADAETAPAAGLVSTVSEFFKKMIFPPLDPNLLEEFDTQKVSWNPHKHCLAFVSGKNQVTVHDFEDAGSKEPCILASDHQKDVKAVEWRPNSGKMIAVGCSSFPRGSGGQWILVDVLRCSSAELEFFLDIFPHTWHPPPAIVHHSQFGMFLKVWLGTPIRRGLSSISLVRWSPSGDYLLAAKFFSMSAMELFTSGRQTLGLQNPGLHPMDMCLYGANWDPEGRVALLSFSNSTTLGSIHFSSKPPSLDAHLLPVELPEISSLIVSRGIEKLAWDASGERLAVSFKDGNEMYRGLVAVYDVRRSPLVSLSLVTIAFCVLEQWLVLYIPTNTTFSLNPSLKRGVSLGSGLNEIAVDDLED
ncbi:hypothetical protein EJB05_51876 [Eragrostis curvula]|uniref:Uncharacterized protein n=1 Tax=Eragrostis curvula TaxID=38414 RepID=A0A5J9SUH3_9POAL|nr:hypothetical protein EJB05_51876 [Eragrostis curvula]